MKPEQKGACGRDMTCAGAECTECSAAIEISDERGRDEMAADLEVDRRREDRMIYVDADPPRRE